MKAQLGLEMLISMLLTLLIIFLLLQSFGNVHLLIVKTNNLLVGITNSVNAYQSRLLQ